MKRNVYSHLNMEDITDSDYVHIKRVFQDFKIKNLEKYHDLYFKAISYYYQMYLRTLEICVLK